MSALFRIGVAATLMMLACSCAHARQLPTEVPQRDAPLEKRLGAYADLGPVARRSEPPLIGSALRGVPGELEVLELRGGYLVDDPHDLAAFIDPDSIVSRDIAQMEQHQRVSSVLTAGGVTATLAGCGLVMFSPIRGSSGSDLGSAAIANPGTAAGVALIVAGLGAAAAALVPGTEAKQARRAAFSHYDDALHARLGLTRDDTRALPVASPK